MFFCIRVMSRWCKDTKDNSELEKLPSSDMSDKGVISSDSGSEKPASNVGVALSRPDSRPKEPNPVCCVLQTAKVRVRTDRRQFVTATVLFLYWFR